MVTDFRRMINRISIPAGGRPRDPVVLAPRLTSSFQYNVSESA
jgi:hypothetical protein